MLLSKCDSLRDLHGHRRDWKIKVRALAAWRGKPVSDTEPGGLHLLLMDDGKTRIHAFINPSIVKRQTVEVVEGSIYIISNFTVNRSNSIQSPEIIRNSKRIFFEDDTKIVTVQGDDSLIPKVHFDCYPYNAVEELANNKTYLVDLIGVVENIVPAHNYNSTKTLVTFFINNGRETMKVKLWNDLCEIFSKAMTGKLEVPVIIVIACSKPNIWQGEVSVSNTSATRIYINCDHPVVHNLRASLKINPESMLNVDEVFENIKNEMKIDQLKGFFKYHGNEKATCNMTLETFDDTKNWFLSVCRKCQVEVQKKDGAYECPKCFKSIIFPDKIYRLYSTAGDDTGKITLLLQDDEVRYIIGKRVFQIEMDIDSDDEDDKANLPIVYPADITNLLYKSYQFTITPYNETDAKIYVATSIELLNSSNVNKVIAEEQQGQTEIDNIRNSESQLIGGHEMTPKGVRKATPGTKASSSKRRLMKKKDVTPFDMDENVPLTQLKVPKKERDFGQKKIEVTYSYATDNSIPWFSLFRISYLHCALMEPEKKLKTVGWINKIDTDEQWFYKACPNCHGETIQKYGFHLCQSCNKMFEKVVNRFKLLAYVEDKEYIMGMTLEHDVVNKLTNYSLHDLLRNTEDGTCFPAELLKLEGLTKVFIVLTKMENLLGNVLVWNCCDCEDIM